VAVVSRSAILRDGLGALLESDPDAHPMTVSRLEPGVDIGAVDLVVYDLAEVEDPFDVVLRFNDGVTPVVGLVRVGHEVPPGLRLAAEVPENVSSSQLIKVVERTVRKARGGDREAGTAAALTPRERRVLGLVAAGLTNAEIAHALGISVNTVKFHVRGVYRRIGARHRQDAVRWAVAHGMV
jgi:DNA-binding CsgD family transcriptional regulator